MELVRNFPFFSIMLARFSGPVCSVLPGKAARVVNAIVISIVAILSYPSTKSIESIL